MDKTGFGKVSQKGKGALPDLRHGILEWEKMAEMAGLLLLLPSKSSEVVVP